jgi:hypothetical protein
VADGSVSSYRKAFSSNNVGLIIQMLLPEQVMKEAIQPINKKGDVVSRLIEIVVKRSFVLLKVKFPDVSCSAHSFHSLWRT